MLMAGGRWVSRQAGQERQGGETEGPWSVAQDMHRITRSSLPTPHLPTATRSYNPQCWAVCVAGPYLRSPWQWPQRRGCRSGCTAARWHQACRDTVLSPCHRNACGSRRGSSHRGSRCHCSAAGSNWPGETEMQRLWGALLLCQITRVLCSEILLLEQRKMVHWAQHWIMILQLIENIKFDHSFC